MNGPKFRVLFQIPKRPKYVTLASDLPTAFSLARGLRDVGAQIVPDDARLRRDDGKAFDVTLWAHRPCGGTCSMTLSVCYAPPPQAVLTPAEIEVLVPKKVNFAGLKVTPIGPASIDGLRRLPRTVGEFVEWMESQLKRLVSRGRLRGRKQ